MLSAFVALSHSRDQALDVVTCGGRPPADQVGPWDKCSGFRSSVEAHDVRAAEHRDVCTALGVRSLALDVIDAQYAGGACGQWQSALPPAAAHLRAFGAGTLVTHAENAWHPDHARVASLACMLGTRLGIPVVAVCDRPYVECSGERCGRATARPCPERRVTVRLSAEQWRSKREVVACYASQRRPLRGAFGASWCSRERLQWECYAVRFDAGGRAGGDHASC